ncbi:diacylglycerol kinase family protein [Convivina intestini]|uniref:Undecaprenol kinase n=1 Tax=Convivina intestini TaxID=1505726 RepID=A0A2U1DF58_9LACO|nr:diacylglycerol kinase family protein [Convivina intestini]PVY86209.1 undecaprenol kinase [Convivina intestini]CAH1851362.1 Undecaprenol kinase [Convivina intestini]CAH1852007.1 Undecaprenol kinase [Convivina intestini]SDB81513.1 diacylglycerol kinase (ATP) [Leuconostocaceae bacterium R-53105]
MASEDKDKQPQVTRNHNFAMALKNALHGILVVVLRERNMRIHIISAFMILLAGLYCGLRRSDWLWVTIGVFLVIYSEFLNTIVESIVDLIVGRRYHVLAGLAKDLAAGLVLVAVGVEMIILLIIFEPYVYHLLWH